MAFINAHQDNRTAGLRWGAEPVCHVLEIAPSTYYGARSRLPSARAVRDAELGPQLVALWQKNYSVYGRRKLAKAARRAGIDAGPRPGGPADAKPRAARRDPGKEVAHHQTGPGGGAGTGPGEPPVHRQRAGPARSGCSRPNCTAIRPLKANGGPWRGLDDLETAACSWVAWFNTERLHSELRDQTPAEIEDRYRQEAQLTAA